MPNRLWWTSTGSYDVTEAWSFWRVVLWFHKASWLEVFWKPVYSCQCVFTGSIEVLSQSTDTVKFHLAHYEFGANFLGPKCMLVGWILTDGKLGAGVKWDLTDTDDEYQCTAD